MKNYTTSSSILSVLLTTIVLGIILSLAKRVSFRIQSSCLAIISVLQTIFIFALWMSWHDDYLFENSLMSNLQSWMLSGSGEPGPSHITMNLCFELLQWTCCWKPSVAYNWSHKHAISDAKPNICCWEPVFNVPSFISRYLARRTWSVPSHPSTRSILFSICIRDSSCWYHPFICSKVQNRAYESGYFVHVIASAMLLGRNGKFMSSRDVRLSLLLWRLCSCWTNAL